MTIGLFVCGVNEVVRLRRPGHTNERVCVRLPRPPWLLERLRHCGLDGCVLPPPSHRGDYGETKALAVALLIISPGSCASGPLHWWESADDEASLQCEYLQDPLDAFSVVIEAVWLLDEPFQIGMARNHVGLAPAKPAPAGAYSHDP